MEPEIRNYVDVLDQLRERFKAAVQNMHAKQLNWVPTSEGSNSPYVLAHHIAGSETMWIHQIVGQLNVARNRDAEFQAAGENPETLIKQFESVAATTITILGKLTLDDLAQLRAQPARRGSGKETVRWCITHVIEHYAEHLGHLDLTHQIYQSVNN